MPQNDRSFASLSESDLETLRRARHALESPSLAIKLSGLLGAPAETIMARLPRFAHRAITSATRLALRQCLRIALRTLRKPGPSDLAAAVPQPRNFAHKIAVAASGATGGALGLLALPVELPLTTTLIFRSICEIARSEGEDLDNLDTQLQCLAVLGLGDVRAAAPGDATDERAADLGYFALRSALAQAVSRASSEVAAKGLAAHTSTALVNLIQNVAARFSTQVTEQAAAKSLPVIGAALGAGANTLFIDHFQQVAHAHFAIRRLERKYGEAAVQAAWHALDGAKR